MILITSHHHLQQPGNNCQVGTVTEIGPQLRWLSSPHSGQWRGEEEREDLCLSTQKDSLTPSGQKLT